MPRLRYLERCQQSDVGNRTMEPWRSDESMTTLRLRYTEPVHVLPRAEALARFARMRAELERLLWPEKAVDSGKAMRESGDAE